MRLRTLASLIIALLCSLLLLACGGRSPSATFYTLEAVHDNAEVSAGGSEPVVIGLRQVVLPPVINRPQIVLIEDEQVKLLEFQRWSEPLDAAMLRLLGDGLRIRLRSPSILTYPWPVTFKPEKTVTVRVSRFNGLPGKAVELSGVWLIDQPGGDQPVRIEPFQIIEPVAGNSYADLVRAHAAALDRLTEQLASDLEK